MEFFGGKLKLDLNVWDITKSILAVVVLIYTINFMNSAERFMNAPKQKWDETTITKIAEGVVKVQVAESNKDLKAAIKALEDASTAIQTAKANDEKIKEIGQAVGRIEDNTVSLAGDIKTFKDRPTATLATANVDLLDANGEKFTIATARYSPDVPEGVEKWSFNTWPRTVTAEVLLTEDDNGRPNRYISLYTQSDWEDDVTKRQPLKINQEDVMWVKGEEKTKKFRFAPRIGFSGMFGKEYIVPALDYSLMSYGRTKVDMTWRFLDLSAGGNKETTLLALTPFSYNIGELLPVISNMFVGPTIAYDLDTQKKDYFFSTSIPF